MKALPRLTVVLLSVYVAGADCFATSGPPASVRGAHAFTPLR
jgi:hypothetical protein